MMNMNRRSFVKSAVAAGTFPLIWNGYAGSFAANKRINVAVIGYGRIAHSMDVPRTLTHTDLCRFVAVCDLDTKRLAYGKKRIEELYRARKIEQTVKTYSDYHEMLQDKSIDAVMLCIPDHQHALVATECLLAGKHIFLQKPFAQTIQEGRIIANIAQMKNLVVQVGSWQRSRPQFHRACELVRNGRLGKIKRVEVGIGLDRSGGCRREEPIPSNLNYDMWLGPTDEKAPYNWTRVHSQDLNAITARPGWIQLAPYGWGMITNWGAHHLDIAAWGLGCDPRAVYGTCEWMDLSGEKLWNVHTTYDLHYDCDGADVHVNNKYQCGVKFVGENDQWIFCTRGEAKVTASDPDQPKKPGQLGALAASKNALLEPMANPKISLLTSNDHFRNWLEAIAAQDPTLTATNAEGGHRSTAFCSLGRMCMELGRGKKDGAKLEWDATKEISNSAEGNAMLVPFARGKYDLHNPLRDYGLKFDEMIHPLA